MGDRTQVFWEVHELLLATASGIYVSCLEEDVRTALWQRGGERTRDRCLYGEKRSKIGGVRLKSFVCCDCVLCMLHIGKFHLPTLNLNTLDLRLR